MIHASHPRRDRTPQMGCGHPRLRHQMIQASPPPARTSRSSFTQSKAVSNAKREKADRDRIDNCLEGAVGLGGRRAKDAMAEVEGDHQVPVGAPMRTSPRFFSPAEAAGSVFRPPFCRRSHGPGPGHSRTIMAAYTRRRNGTVGQAVPLGLSMALSHSLSWSGPWPWPA